MKRYTIALALVAIFSLTGIGRALAAPGAQPFGFARAEYNSATGEIVVSSEVNSWIILSGGDLLLGPPANTVLPTGVGLLVTDTQSKLGEASFTSLLSYTDLSLGNVAQTGIQYGDLFIEYSTFGVPDVVSVHVCFDDSPCGVPEPATLALAGFGLCGVIALRRRRVA